MCATPSSAAKPSIRGVDTLHSFPVLRRGNWQEKSEDLYAETAGIMGKAGNLKALHVVSAFPIVPAVSAYRCFCTLG
jgi:hypothetical protein